MRFYMGLRYKINILEALKTAGYTTTKLRKDKLLAEGVLTSLRRGESISWKNIEAICKLLDYQPGDILEYVPDEE